MACHSVLDIVGCLIAIHDIRVLPR